jgi:hypothetical protein
VHANIHMVLTTSYQQCLKDKQGLRHVSAHKTHMNTLSHPWIHSFSSNCVCTILIRDINYATIMYLDGGVELADLVVIDGSVILIDEMYLC